MRRLMNIAGAAAAAALSVLAAGCADTAPRQARLVILAGQSNALGYDLDPRALPAELARPDSQVLIWDGQAFSPLTPGVNTGSPRQPGTWGPEVAFARAWRDAHPEETLYIVKYARGSTALAAGPGRDWSPASRGELYAEATTAVRAARAALGRDARRAEVSSALIWLQGETDAADGAAAAAYERNLADFLRSARRDWAQPDTPVLLVKIPKWGGRADVIRAAQAKVDAADPRTDSVDAAGLPLQPDGLHITTDGQLRLGRAMARAMDQLDG